MGGKYLHPYNDRADNRVPSSLMPVNIPVRSVINDGMEIKDIEISITKYLMILFKGILK